MNRTYFLADQNILDFVNFISEKWFGDFIFNLNIGRGKNRTLIEIHSIREAFENYKWPYSIKDITLLPTNAVRKSDKFEDSSFILNYAELLLRSGDKIQGARLTLAWGGVKNRNEDTVMNGRTSFCDGLSLVSTLWTNLSQDQIELTSDIKPGYVSNAGFTKIYSLVLDNFIIYDSRVAVALTFLIERCFGDNIPEILKLYVPAGRVGEKEKRKVNPFFEPTYQKDSRHFYSNVKASWILGRSLDLIKKRDENVSLRMLEAALFMIGNDISN